jgi:hypothetical protein
MGGLLVLLRYRITSGRATTIHDVADAALHKTLALIFISSINRGNPKA